MTAGAATSGRGAGIGCGLDFAGGPGNCGAVDPRPDTSSPHVPYDGERFHLIDILTREERPGP